MVNDVIKANLPIQEKVLTREEAGKIVSLTRLPEDAGENVRIIAIGDYDLCPCSGVHALRTSEIGEFKIISTDCTNGRTSNEIQDPWILSKKTEIIKSFR